MLPQNFFEVRRNVEAAVGRRGVFKESLPRLLGATKRVSVDEINYAVSELGLDLIGENRADELCEKYPLIDKRAEIHFIGTLQTNKVKYIIDKVSMIHSLDSVRLAEEIDRQAKKYNKIMDALVEINIGEEDAKSGIAPDEIEEFLSSVSKFGNVRLRGIMTMAPKCADSEEYRKYFKETYQIFIDILTKKTHNIVEPVLSMGMSDSYAVAIEEGSDIIRVGQGLFGARTAR